MPKSRKNFEEDDRVFLRIDHEFKGEVFPRGSSGQVWEVFIDYDGVQIVEVNFGSGHIYHVRGFDVLRNPPREWA